jgi:hypothetical protein
VRIVAVEHARAYGVSGSSPPAGRAGI